MTSYPRRLVHRHRRQSVTSRNSQRFAHFSFTCSLISVAILVLLACGALTALGQAPAAKKNVTLRFLVKQPNGKVASGARINIWHDYTGPETGPPDYQVNQINSNGRQEIVVAAGITSEVTVEITHGEFRSEFNIALSRPTIDKTVLLRKTENTDFFAKDPSELAIVKVSVRELREVRKVRGKVPTSDVGPAISDASVSFQYYQGSGRTIYEGKTGPDGDLIKSIVPMNYTLEINKTGYEPATAFVSLRASDAGKSVNAPVVKLKKLAKPTASVELKVTIIRAGAGTGVDQARVDVVGKNGYKSETYFNKTESDGVAVLTLAEYGQFEITVTKSNYETYTGSFEVKQGATDKTLPVIFLTEKPQPKSSEYVKVNVVAKGGKAIKGANVSANGKATQTDDEGMAEFTTAFNDESEVRVTVQAKGFKTQSILARVVRDARNYYSATARSTFVMEPGEDAATEDSPYVLIVEVLNSFTNKPVKGVNVVIHNLADKFLYQFGTDQNGKITFSQAVSAIKMEPAELRKGVMVNVEEAPGYKEKKYVLAEFDKKPSNTPHPFLVYIDPDWAELTKQMAALEGRFVAWKADLALLAGNVKTVKDLGAELAKAEAAALTLFLDRFKLAAICEKRLKVANGVAQLERDSTKIESDLKALLDQAMPRSQSCSTIAQADSLKADYLKAVQMVASIGAKKKAMSQSAENMRLLSSDTAADDKKVRDFKDEYEKLKKAIGNNEMDLLAIRISDAFNSGNKLVKSLPTRRDALLGEIEALKKAAGLDAVMTGLPPSLKNRLNAMSAVLRAASFTPPSVELGTSADRRTSITSENLASIDTFMKQFATWKCNYPSFEEALGRMSDTLASATIELAAADSVRQEVTACVARTTCEGKIAEIRTLLATDRIEAAETGIVVARTKGCDLTKVLTELDDYKLVRQGKDFLGAAKRTCKFREALEFANRFPLSFLNEPTIETAVKDAERGLVLQRRVDQLKKGPRQPNDLSELQRLSRGYQCLLNEISLMINEDAINRLTEDASKPKPATTTPGVTAPTAGALARSAVIVKPNPPPGRDYSYTFGEATASYTTKDGYGKHTQSITWNFSASGIGGSLTPGQVIRINITGAFSSSDPNWDRNPPFSAGVAQTGLLDGGKSENAFASKAPKKRDGEYIFIVPANARTVRITFWGDYGIGNFAMYCWGECK